MTASSRPPVGVLWLAWSVLGGILVLQLYLARPWPESFGMHAFYICSQMFRVWIWALLTPAILRWSNWVGRRQRRWSAWAWHLSGSLVLAFLCNLVRIGLLFLVIPYQATEPVTAQSILGVFSTRAALDFLFYWLIVGVRRAYQYWETQRTAGLREERLQARLAHAELTAFKQQLHPHFLFNSLNAVAALIRGDEKEKAADAVAQLSGLLRQLMQNSATEEIELRRELDYVQRYLQIEQLRFGTKLRVEFDVDEQCLALPVPTLILQPLVENAVKHGIALRRTPGLITIAARWHDPWLQLEVSNDPSETPVPPETDRRPHLGLATMTARLKKLFDREFRMTTDFIPGRKASAVIELVVKQTHPPGTKQTS